MKKSDEISSTEKLLDVIRNRRGGIQQGNENVNRELTEKEYTSSLMTFLPFKKKVTLSVIIGNYDLTLVMVSRISGQHWNLLDYQKVPYKQGITRDHKRFSSFLKSAILLFSNHIKPDYIWSSIPSVRFETRFLTIPKVSVNHTPEVVYFSFKKVIPDNEDDFIFDFEILNEVLEGRSHKLKVFAYTAPAAEVEKIRKLFLNIGYPLTGISIIPFAVQNILRSALLGPLPDNICTLYVGKDWSRIDIFSKGNLVLSRDIKTGINSIVEAVKSEYYKDEDGENYLSQKTKNITKHPEKQNQENEDLSEKIFRDLLQADSVLSSGGKTSIIQNKAMLDIIYPVINRLVRQVERTFQHFTVNFGKATIGKVFITGKLCAHQHVIDLISQQLNFQIENIDLFKSGPLHLNEIDIPDQVYDRDAFVPAIGLAVSHNSRTPNLFYTYLQKGIIARIKKINQYVFIAFIAFMTACIGFFYWQGHVMKAKKVRIAKLNTQLEKFNPLVEKELILKILSVTEKKRLLQDSQAESWLSVAVITELSQLTPSNIRLTKVNADFFTGPSKTKNKRKNIVIVEGLVFQEGSSPDADLAMYLIKLGGSPIFKQTKIREKSIQMINGKKVLYFTARLELV